MDLYKYGTRTNENRMIGQSPLVEEPTLLLQHAGVLPNPSDLSISITELATGVLPAAALESFSRNSHLSLETLF